MNIYKTTTTVERDGILTLTAVPFHQGDRVEVVVVAIPPATAARDPFPLRGKIIRYDQPTDPIAESDWEADQ